MNKFFYDSYAIFEYLKGNQKYQKYFDDPIGITTRFNLMEVFYHLYKEEGEEYANEIYNSFLTVCIEVSDEQIKNAMKLRKSLKDDKLNISFVDAIGYSIAKENGLLFLTGDEDFEHLPSVEYVKK